MIKKKLFILFFLILCTGSVAMQQDGSWRAWMAALLNRAKELATSPYELWKGITRAKKQPKSVSELELEEKRSADQEGPFTYQELIQQEKSPTEIEREKEVVQQAVQVPEILQHIEFFQQQNEEEDRFNLLINESAQFIKYDIELAEPPSSVEESVLSFFEIVRSRFYPVELRKLHTHYLVQQDKLTFLNRVRDQAGQLNDMFVAINLSALPQGWFNHLWDWPTIHAFQAKFGKNLPPNTYLFDCLEDRVAIVYRKHQYENAVIEQPYKIISLLPHETIIELFKIGEQGELILEEKVPIPGVKKWHVMGIKLYKHCWVACCVPIDKWKISLPVNGISDHTVDAIICLIGFFDSDRVMGRTFDTSITFSGSELSRYRFVKDISYKHIAVQLQDILTIYQIDSKKNAISADPLLTLNGYYKEVKIVDEQWIFALQDKTLLVFSVTDKEFVYKKEEVEQFKINDHILMCVEKEQAKESVSISFGYFNEIPNRIPAEFQIKEFNKKWIMGPGEIKILDFNNSSLSFIYEKPWVSFLGAHYTKNRLLVYRLPLKQRPLSMLKKDPIQEEKTEN